MKNILFKILFLLIIQMSFSCTPTKFHIKEFTSPEFKKEVIRTVAVFDVKGDELSKFDKRQITDMFFSKIKYNEVALFDYSDFYNEENNESYLSSWDIFWNNYLNSKEVDAVTLFEISEKIKTNAVLQIAVVDVEKIFGQHRKTIGQTTANLKLALFSLKSGKLLWEADVTGTQANVHSDQVIPKLIEAVNVAIINIADKLPFN